MEEYFLLPITHPMAESVDVMDHQPLSLLGHMLCHTFFLFIHSETVT